MRVAAIAPWFRLRLPSCGPGFESQANHLCFFQFVLLKLYRENDKNKQKEARIGPFFNSCVCAFFQWQAFFVYEVISRWLRCIRPSSNKKALTCRQCYQIGRNFAISEKKWKVFGHFLRFWQSFIVVSEQMGPMTHFCIINCPITKSQPKGSGCDTDGRAVTFKTRGPRFESNDSFSFMCYKKTQIKKKRPEMFH